MSKRLFTNLSSWGKEELFDQAWGVEFDRHFETFHSRCREIDLSDAFIEF